MSQSSVPNEQDLVLGGQLPPPLGGAVLGGLAGLEQRFSQTDVKQKLAALAEVAQYGMSALPLVEQELADDDLNVRCAAYVQLKAIQPNHSIVERGIPLKVGDRIYGVYESSVSYGDDFYYIGGRLSDWYEEDHSIYQASQDSHGLDFEYISDHPADNPINPYDDYDDPNLILYTVERATAEIKAQVVYQEKFGKLYCEIYEIDRYDSDNPREFDLKAWVDAHQIVVDNTETWGDHDWEYENQVLTSLQRQKQFDLLQELWQQKGYPPLGFVHEYVIDRSCYLPLKDLQS